VSLKRLLGLDTRPEKYAYALDPVMGYTAAGKIPDRWVPTPTKVGGPMLQPSGHGAGRRCCSSRCARAVSERMRIRSR